MDIEKELSGVRKNVSLAEYTTFKIGGPAKYFFESRTKKDLIKAVLSAGKLNLPFFILAGGSNLLISDEGYDGLIIKLQFSEISQPESDEIIAEAGLSLNKLVNFSLEKELSGLEWAAGIPGTVGGAIYGNAGSFEKSIGEVVREVEVLDVAEEKIKIIKKEDCQFSYRESIFKNNKNLVILSARFKLTKGDKEEIENRMKEYLEKKKNSQPIGFPSAGSIFKNPEGFSAGRLIEKCGLKGKRVGGAEISSKHANFIINYSGKARAEDVKRLIDLVEKEVKNKFKINLEKEIVYLKFKN